MKTSESIWWGFALVIVSILAVAAWKISGFLQFIGKHAIILFNRNKVLSTIAIICFWCLVLFYAVVEVSK